MSITVIGFSTGERLTENTLFRITLADHWYNASSFTFPDAAKALYQSLYSVAHMLPTTTLGVVSGDHTAVFDANLKGDTDAASLVNALDQLGSTWAFVDRVERLTGSARDDSSSSDGTMERDTQKATANAETGASNAVDKLFSALSQAGSVVKWAGAGALAIAAIYFIGPYISRKK